jgi:hypothetical protein
MKYPKSHILFALMGVLAILYATNIFFTRSLSAIMIDVPTKVSFAIIEGPEGTCDNCFDASTISTSIDSAYHIKYKTKNIPYNSPLSKQYIEKYHIQNLPAVVITGDITNDKVIVAWEALAGKEVNNGIVIENLLPYYDIQSATVKGMITATLVKDTTCVECFDENIYITILQNFGLVVSNTQVSDIASLEGQALVAQYAITKVPTLILSPETNEYPNFISAWAEVGTREHDGSLVLRDVEKINPQFKQL